MAAEVNQDQTRDAGGTEATTALIPTTAFSTFSLASTASANLADATPAIPATVTSIQDQSAIPIDPVLLRPREANNSNAVTQPIDLLSLRPLISHAATSSASVPIAPILQPSSSSATATSLVSVGADMLDPNFVRSIGVFHDSVSSLLAETYDEYDLVVNSPTTEEAAAALHVYFCTILKLQPRSPPPSDDKTRITIRVDSQRDEDPPTAFRRLDILTLYPQMCV